MSTETLLAGLRRELLDFEDVQDSILARYDYHPTAFDNGELHNAAGQNEGSCRLLAFALLNSLGEQDTLLCFGRHYRQVLATPEGSDHGNIRNFMRHGWSGVRFHGQALTAKPGH